MHKKVVVWLKDCQYRFGLPLVPHLKLLAFGICSGGINLIRTRAWFKPVFTRERNRSNTIPYAHVITIKRTRAIKRMGIIFINMLQATPTLFLKNLFQRTQVDCLDYRPTWSARCVQ